MVTKSRYLCVLLGVLLSGGLLVAAVDFLDVDSKALIIGNGSIAVVTGQVRCTEDDTLNLAAVLAQNVKQGSVLGSGFSNDDICTGLLQSFVITVPIIYPADGVYKKGPASLTVQASSCDPVTFVCSDSVTITTRTHMQ